MNHKLCAHSQCPECHGIPLLLREAIVEIRNTLNPIGNSLKDNEAYLRWLYIEALKEKQGAEVIYVPTEAGLPILEAGKRK